MCWINASQHVGCWIGHGDEAILGARDLVRELAERYRVRELSFDPWRSNQLAVELQERGIQISAFPRTDTRMIPARCGFTRLIKGSHCPEHAPPAGRGSTRAWRTLRKRVLECAGGRCERCGQPASDIHHLEPVVATGRADTKSLSLLQALCGRCHRKAHEGPDQDGVAT